MEYVLPPLAKNPISALGQSGGGTVYWILSVPGSVRATVMLTLPGTEFGGWCDADAGTARTSANAATAGRAQRDMCGWYRGQATISAVPSTMRERRGTTSRRLSCDTQAMSSSRPGGP